MRFGYNETCLSHETGPRHPESPDRLRAVRQSLGKFHGARFDHPGPATGAQIRSVHDPDYVSEIETFCENGGGSWDTDTVISEQSCNAALASAGLAVWAAEEAVKSSNCADAPFALCRPPGHHALSDDAMGFCLFNNAAVAAQASLDTGMAETVAIIDWDVHHGNGTQEIFEERGDVPYVSIHEDGLYPGTGAMEEIGIGEGAGANLNVPLAPGATTAGYLATFTEVIEPWLRRHQPDLLLVSAGFDAHRHDPISRMAVTTEGFGVMTERILHSAETTDAAVGFILEGGYGLDTLSSGVCMVHEVCGGYQPEQPTNEPRPVDHDQLSRARAVHGIGS